MKNNIILFKSKEEESRLYEDIKVKYGDAITRDMYDKIRESVINDPGTVREIREIEEEIDQKSREIQAKYEEEKKEILEEKRKILEERRLLLKEIRTNQKQIEKLRQQINQRNSDKEYKGVGTYSNLFRGVRKKLEGTLGELEEDGQLADELLTNLIMNDETLNDSEKDEALLNVDNKTDNSNYKINKWLGKKLTVCERRLLRTLRCIIFKMINKEIDQEGLTGVGKSIYEVEIPLSRIYEEYGLEKRPYGGYQHKQTKIIQGVLFGLPGYTKGLHEEMLFKQTRIIRTKLIIHIEELKQKAFFEKGLKNPEEKIQIIGARIVMLRALFVSDSNLNDFFYQDVEGFKRFMSLPDMRKSDLPFYMAEYLEYYLSSKLERRVLDLDTLLNELGIRDRYKKNKGEVERIIKRILDNMVIAKYLIKSWKMGRGAKSQPQLTFENSRYELFKTSFEQTENNKLAKIKKKSTKNKKKYL